MTKGAVLFDWGETLAHAEWSDELAVGGNRAGLEAIGRSGLPPPEEISRWFVEHGDEILSAGSVDEVDMVEVFATCFVGLGCELTADEVERYEEASSRFWWSRYELHPEVHGVLDALRERGYKLGIVSNTATRRRVLDQALDDQGLTGRIDHAVFSSELRKRKPDPAIFRAALDALAIDPRATYFVGDRLYEDVLGAGALGMKTAQALWFREDENPSGGVPDRRLRSPSELLEVVDG